MERLGYDCARFMLTTGSSGCAGRRRLVLYEVDV